MNTQGRIYFGNKLSPMSFNKKNSKEIIKKVMSLFSNIPFENQTNRFTYSNQDFIRTNEGTFKKKIKEFSINENSLKNEYTLEPIAFFPQGVNNYSYKLTEDHIIFNIDEKIKLIITQNDDIYLEYIKDHSWDVTEPKLINIISTIHTVYN